MNPALTKLLQTIIIEIAKEVADRVINAQHNPAKVAPADVDNAFQVEVSVDRSPEEWRADCLELINTLAPTHGPQLRGIFASMSAKNLRELKPEQLPALLAELVTLRDAK